MSERVVKRKFQGINLPMGALLLGVAAAGVGLLLCAFGVKFTTVVLGRMAAGWSGITLLAFATGMCIEFWSTKGKSVQCDEGGSWWWRGC